jgi:hypothetical protein
VSSELGAIQGSDMRLIYSFDELVIYQGNITVSDKYQSLGGQPSKIDQKEIIVLLRLYSLLEIEEIINLYLEKVRAWKRHGVIVTGLEVDYDSPSYKLNEYAEWLKRLNKDFQGELSVTSLGTYTLDNPTGLKLISGSVDYISMQLYKGYVPYSHYEKVVDWLNLNGIPHVIGITLSEKFPVDSSICLEFCNGVRVFLNIKE